MLGSFSARMLASTQLLNLYTMTSSLIAGHGSVNFIVLFNVDLFFFK